MIVVDASVLVAVLVEAGKPGDRARDRLRDESAAAPALIDAEVLSVLRGLVLARKLPEENARTALRLLVAMPLQRAPLSVLLGRSWELRSNYSAYDALYVALAESLDCPLITNDARLARANGARCPIEVLG